MDTVAGPRSEAVYVALGPGELAPWFRQRCAGNPRYTFDTAAGRWILLHFYGSAADPLARSSLDDIAARRALFDDARLSYFGVGVDPRDEHDPRAQDAIPGVRHIRDQDGRVSRLYGALPRDWSGGPAALRPLWMVLDPAMRVHAVFQPRADGSERAELFALLEQLPQLGAACTAPAPILILPHVFERSLCEALIAAYEAAPRELSGFMREIDGETRLISDASHKLRRDALIDDPALVEETQRAIRTRVAPQIQRAFQFEVTRMERYLVGCYRAADGGHFRPHRDNTTPATAHRRFAVSVFLNDGYEGGDLAFPEFGPKTYRAPPGAAVVFSCSLLHTVAPVTRGERYVFAPFLYDEEGARQRTARARAAGAENRPGGSS